MTFQEENNLLLKNSLQDSFFKVFRKEKLNKQEEQIHVEFCITPDCNQNCSYCYLCKQKDLIYPKNLRDHQLIINNLYSILNYFSENKFHIPVLDLFSGEIWDSDFGIEILNIITDYILTKKIQVSRIMIPSNCSFVLNEKYLNQIEQILEKINLNDQLTTKIYFSCSNDGYYIDAMTRPFNDKNKQEIKTTEEYYNKIFNFIKKWNFGCHPMVSAHGIEYWCENYQWWMESLEAHGLDPLSHSMFLETRNDDWTDEKIIHYLKYLNFSVDYLLNNKFNNNIELYYKYISGTLHQKYNKYNSLRIHKTTDWPTCSIARSLVIRLGDLAIIPCHRTSYDEFIIGFFVSDESGTITDITAKNISLMNQIWFNNLYGTAECNHCAFRDLCVRGCYGAQFESTKELFYPCESVCNLFKARIIFLYLKYEKIGVLHNNRHLINIIQSIEETEEYKKWKKIILTLI